MYNYVAETEINDIHVISVRGTVCLFVYSYILEMIINDTFFLY